MVGSVPAAAGNTRVAVGLAASTKPSAAERLYMGTPRVTADVGRVPLTPKGCQGSLGRYPQRILRRRSAQTRAAPLDLA